MEVLTIDPNDPLLTPTRTARQKQIPLSIIQLLLMNSIVCGLEFCASAAFTYIPPMLLKAGLSEQNMTGVLGIGPFLGFLIVPIIGRASDRCQSRFGRRRPFILGLSLMVVISLFIIPYGELFGIYALGKENFGKPFGLTLLIIGSIMLDFSSQACLTPCEALLSDACRSTGQQDTCFTVYSFMVSLGGCIGYLITALDWSSSSVGLYFGGQEQSAFSLLIVLFIITTFASLGVVDERPFVPSDLSEGEANISQTLDRIHTDIVHHKDTLIPQTIDPGYESGSNQSASPQILPQNGHLTEVEHMQIVDTNNSKNSCAKGRINGISVQRKVTDLSVIKNVKHWLWWLKRRGFSSLLSGLWVEIYYWLPRPLRLLFSVPYVLRGLALANFCSWTAVMSFNLFYTDFVGQAVYGGDPNAADDSPAQRLYDEGVRSGSWGLLFHCVFSALSAACIERIVRRFGMKQTYCMGMASFATALFAMSFCRDIIVVNFLASCTGFAYATVTTIPFMLVSNYHDNKELFFYDEHLVSGQTPVRGIGSDMATLDSAYFLSQALLSVFMGAIVELSGTVMTYVLVSGTAGFVACYFIQKVVFTKQHMIDVIRSDRLRAAAYVLDE